jgi:hypothetical protein
LITSSVSHKRFPHSDRARNCEPRCLPRSLSGDLPAQRVVVAPAWRQGLQPPVGDSMESRSQARYEEAKLRHDEGISRSFLCRKRRSIRTVFGGSNNVVGIGGTFWPRFQEAQGFRSLGSAACAEVPFAGAPDWAYLDGSSGDRAVGSLTGALLSLTGRPV